jgi:hypothetical protein
MTFINCIPVSGENNQFRFPENLNVQNFFNVCSFCLKPSDKGFVGIWYAAPQVQT